MTRKATPSKDGSWLSTPGPYQTYIKSLCAADPSLRKADAKAIERGTPPAGYTPRAVVLEVEGTVVSRKLETTKPEELQQHFDQLKPEVNKRRRLIYLLEGFSQAFVGVVGNRFMMHPAFFKDHNKVSKSQFNDRGEEILLPSVACGKDDVCLKYSELVALPPGMKAGVSIRCAETGRKLALTRVFGEISPISMLSRKCSYWSCSEPSAGGWNLVVLCDPPVRMAYKLQNHATAFVSNEPWEGGYVDFLPRAEQMKCLAGPPRNAMLDDLCYYLQQHSRHIDLHDERAPALFIKKIVTCHYARHFEYLRRVILKTQQKLAHHIDLQQFTIPEVESQWSEVQTLARRLAQGCRDLADIMAQLGIPENTDQPDVVLDWKDTASDFRFLHKQCQALEHHAEMLNSSITGLASIVGNRHAFKEQRLSQQAAERSVQEAQRARALVAVGLVFIPLSLTSSLFSMAQPYGPGQGKFWVYIAVAFPFTALVLLVYYVFDIISLRRGGYRSKDSSESLL